MLEWILSPRLIPLRCMLRTARLLRLDDHRMGKIRAFAAFELSYTVSLANLNSQRVLEM